MVDDILEGVFVVIKKNRRIIAVVLTLALLVGIVSLSSIEAQADNRPILSVMGDSISSYYGYGNYGLPYYGPSQESVEADGYVMSKDNIWWSLVTGECGYRLGYNSSKSGSYISSLDIDYYSFQNKRRLNDLAINGTPDVIVVYGGINDAVWLKHDPMTFWFDYDQFISMLRNQYPNSRVVCVSPYYVAFFTPDSNIDFYSYSISETAKKYNCEYVDNRDTVKSFTTDDCARQNSFHPNENGERKIADVIGGALRGTKINSVNYSVGYGSYSFSINAHSNNQANIRYRLKITNASNGNTFYTAWQKGSNINWVDGIDSNCNYHITAQIDDNYDDRADAQCTTVVNNPRVLSADTSIYVHQHTHNNITVGLCNNLSNVNDFEFQWLGYDVKEQRWFVISDWTRGNVWMSWNPGKSGDFWIYGQVRKCGSSYINGSSVIAISHSQFISGTCQMPNPNWGGGWLIGISTYDNPNNSYRYELCVLDCNRYVNGDPNPWVYTTGKMNTGGGNTAWTIWQPQHGYYWTLFRIYDASGNLIDEKCFGAVA